MLEGWLLDGNDSFGCWFGLWETLGEGMLLPALPRATLRSLGCKKHCYDSYSTYRLVLRLVLF